MELKVGNRFSVFVAQAKDLQRIGLLATLDGKFAIAGSASTGRAAIEYAEKMKPDIAVLSMFFTDINGTDVTRQIQERSPQTKVIMLTSDDCPDHILDALGAGASAYFLHDHSTASQLVEGIRAVASGSVCLGSDVARKVFERVDDLFSKNLPKRISPSQEKCFGLSKRELEVLRLIADGHTNRQIAKMLFVSEDTVKTHARHIMEKLQVTDRTQAAVKALQLDVLDPTCCTKSRTVPEETVQIRVLS